MLGLRTALKDDLQSLSAELVYRQLLEVPEDFIPNITEPWSATQKQNTLLDIAKAFTPVPMSQHGLLEFHVPPNLKAVNYVFIP
ncbi:hypothetical protein LDENG_00067160 [Lucifuga dentata]|nr:hypothetical protein LDENG_00067160 [Lucifuga dentata]